MPWRSVAARRGLSFEGKDSYEDIRFVFMLLANEKAKNYLSFLAALARAFQDNTVMDHLWMAREKTEFKNAVRKAFAGADDRPARRRTKFNKLLTDEAAKIAKAAECSTILIFTDVFPPTLAPRMTFPGFKLVLAGQDVTDEDKVHHRANATLAVRALSRSRLSQLRAAILLGLTREIFGFQDRVCCIGEFPTAGSLTPSSWSTPTRNSSRSSDKVTKCCPTTIRRSPRTHNGNRHRLGYLRAGRRIHRRHVRSRRS